MTSSNTNISFVGGYDVNVIGDYPPQLHCGICTLIMQNAMHGCSNHMFCEACITKHIQLGIRIEGNVVCPGGCAKVINPTKLEPSLFVDRMINTLGTKCSNTDCTWQGDLLDLVQVHQRSCDYALQSCGNQGCNEKLLKKDIIQHNENCLFKVIECIYCQKDMLRKNKEQHDMKCLNEQVGCIYHDIGCTKKFCRREVQSHEDTHQSKHMKLMHQNLIDAKQQILSSNNKINVLEQQNAAWNKKFNESHEEVLQLKQEMKSITTEFQGLKKENSSSDLKQQNNVVNTSNHQANDIDHLKEKVIADSDLCGKVTLVNNDKVMIVKSKDNINFSFDNFSYCYKKNEFGLLLNLFCLNDHERLVFELLEKIPFHMYDYLYGNGIHRYIFTFPLDLNNIKDIHVLIPDIFKIKILNNELLFETLNNQCYSTIQLFMGRYGKKLQLGEKFNLKKLDSCKPRDNTFAPGLACLNIW